MAIRSNDTSIKDSFCQGEIILLNRILFFVPVIVSGLVLSCAIRSNPFDPQSPNPRPPDLNVAISYDTSKVKKVRNDTIYAKGPFPILITVAASFASDSHDLPVSMTHFYNLELESPRIEIHSDSITLKKGGLHYLLFETEGKNGISSQYEINLFIDAQTRPSIVSWKADTNRLPYRPALDDRPFVKLSTVINDPDSLVDSLVIRPCYYRPQDTIDYHTPEDMIRDDDTLYDEWRFLPSFNIDENVGFCFSEDFQCWTRLFLYHKLGLDSVGMAFYFYDTIFYYGYPPHINAITVDPADNIPERTDIIFTVDWIDPDEGEIVSYFWDFGDSTTKTSTGSNSITHSYAEKGNYRVKVQIEDDSGNVDTGSIPIEILPKISAPPYFDIFKVEYKDSTNSFVEYTDSADLTAPLEIWLTAVPKTGGSLNSITELFIDFGDGSDPVTPTVPKTDRWPYEYQEPGTYILEAVVSDDKGNRVSIQDTILVKE